MSELAPEVPEDLFREVKYYAVGDIDPQVPPARGPSVVPSPVSARARPAGLQAGAAGHAGPRRAAGGAS